MWRHDVFLYAAGFTTCMLVWLWVASSKKKK